ncbi:hypothetical protein A2715_01275 [Candidatus Woesebacteria bacterium RIFCSPHIGHO2_01_FULL_39_32]|uniref:DUF2079 domain-containing protein n=1 Tax=Candidatus Woesebacteria bacterium RIFCSPLOWO2_01_FULL_39_25 TaxID=1802521 RepID=A0A1F8BQ36_9BACT|nr:MAG: hypothetical protein A2124_02960 [Candidatus Woesebacteria bacterium GWB1_37_5]OGM24374.1 MAG: hypothetical protein A2715_01275 [Candidatus Woesebacteria bacterium RIFCSPHIGHO2_01_FULL_39_32]OGM37282.1 MAG: hypothetical protein A3F01_01105 [Candidatus Woesebacteria bacterium RIFCSPHIGHO2_12_FULL_38_11]OGM65398.1 MAG: hypothetical protein A2893_01635 [Candidatus Woesebacteria bacterium RIFCSPLOWO2_01_FULL_39_25]
MKIKSLIILIIKKQRLILFILVISYLLLFSYLSFAQHDGLKTQMNDLGNMDQPIFNTTRGRLMQASNCYNCGQPIINRLGGHANFIFLFFVPIYAIFPNPKVLLFTQTLLIALGSFPLYWIGRRFFGEKSWISLIGPLIYLLNPMVQDVNLYDFHATSVAMPLIIFAFYFLYIKQDRLFYLFSILVVIAKEDMALIIFMMGLFIMLYQREIKRGLFVSLASLLYFFLVNELLMPLFLGGMNHPVITQRYSYLGDNVFKILINLITHPLSFMAYLFTPEKTVYLVALLFPVIFLPVFSLEVLALSLPSVLINLLSSFSMMYYPFQYYYMAPILAFIFLATIFSLYKIYKNKRILLGTVTFSLLVTTFTISFLASPAPYSLVSSWREFKVDEHAKRISRVKERIDSEASLSAQNNLGAHFSQRSLVYTFPLKAHESDFVFLDVNDPFEITRTFPRNRSFEFITQMFLSDYKKEIISMFEDPNYGVYYFSEDGYLLFKKGVLKDKNKDAQKMFEKQLEQIATLDVDS